MDSSSSTSSKTQTTPREKSAPRGESPVNRAPKKAWRRFIPWVAGGLVLLWIAKSMQPVPMEVELATVSVGPLVVSVLEEGETRIRHRYTVSPPVGGYLNRVTLRPGARIEAGKTVLATLQPQPAAFLDARTRSEAEARLHAAEAAQRQRESQLERSREALDLAEKDQARARTLKDSGAISGKEWDAAQNQARVLSREVRAAEFAMQVAAFELAQAKAALVQTEWSPTDGTPPLQILAPVNGYVLTVTEESARTLAAGAPIMEVGDPADLEAEIELLSSDAVRVLPGADVQIEQWGGDAPLRGRVTVVEPGGYTKVSALGVEEQRVRVRVDFAEPLPAGVMIGDRFRVEARIITWRSDAALQIPTGALFRRGGDWMTFVMDGGKARLEKIEIGRSNGIAAEVRSGVAAGARVILHPPDALTGGASVTERKKPH